jgi:hypothetical protein
MKLKKKISKKEKKKPKRIRVNLLNPGLSLKATTR